MSLDAIKQRLANATPEYGWELVWQTDYDQLRRFSVPNGWLYQYQLVIGNRLDVNCHQEIGITFVPDDKKFSITPTDIAKLIRVAEEAKFYYKIMEEYGEGFPANHDDLGKALEDL